MKASRAVCALAMLAAVLLVGCSTVPETGRRQMNLYSSQEEMQLGLTEFNKMKQEVPISKDASANAMVQRVGKRIAAVATLPDAQWEFVVFESAEANAFCLPGGKVGIYTGILPICKDDAGLAAVMGHEVAHAVAHHGGERMTEAQALGAVGQVGSAILGSSKYASWAPFVTQAYGVGAQLGVALPHSRAQESEADEIGLVYMARAGYPPAAAVAFWQRFAEYNQSHGGANTAWFLSTHPTDATRIADLQKLLPKAEAEYRAAGGK
ncbi:MAG: M48 family metallopeptidase [Verrucomicrobiae bacterium]|nr:M48 family metallopeptidase [Verrucomicrobiae bacterium]